MIPAPDDGSNPAMVSRTGGLTLDLTDDRNDDPPGGLGDLAGFPTPSMYAIGRLGRKAGAEEGSVRSQKSENPGNAGVPTLV